MTRPTKPTAAQLKVLEALVAGYRITRGTLTDRIPWTGLCVSHPDGSTVTVNHQTLKAMWKRGWVTGRVITDAGRAVLAAAGPEQERQG